MTFHLAKGELGRANATLRRPLVTIKYECDSGPHTRAIFDIDIIRPGGGRGGARF